MTLLRFYDEALAQAAYLVACDATGEAAVVDSGLDFGPILDAAERKGYRIVAVTETHIHADYVSGSKALAEAVGARLYLSAEGPPEWQYGFAAASGAQLLRDGDVIEVGNLSLRAMHTPGHTPEHLAFLLTDHPAGEEPVAIFSGDLLFVGDVGRPDLLERAAGFEGTMEAGARTLYHTLQRLKELPDGLLVWPAHGSGSACGKSLGGSPVTTIGYEKRTNWGLRAATEDAFVREVLDGQPEPPAYFAEMKRVNKVGPGPLPPAPQRLPASSLASWLARAQVVDLRGRSGAAQLVVRGAVSVPMGGQFPTWAGSLFSPDERLVLLAKDGDEASEAARMTACVGLQVEGWIEVEAALAEAARTGLAEAPPLTPAAEVPALVAAGGSVLVDVRRATEAACSRIEGTLHAPLARIQSAVAELPGDKRLLVHCASGMRALVAASYLRARGLDASAVAEPYEDVRCACAEAAAKSPA